MRLLLLATLLLITAVAPLRAADKPSTAGRGVSVLPAPFTIAGLNRPRTVRLYLPPSYGQAGERRYPVIYMHDGQNLFDDATAYAGEWGVDETLDALAASHGFEAIVVGVDNGGERRMTELNPWPHPRFGAAEGEPYLAFIVDTLRPWVDSHYRTLSGPEHTAIMGSSMGGLISDYAVHRYPRVFGRSGVFSPSYWAAPGIYDYAGSHPLPMGARVWFSMGGREGESALLDVRRMHALMAAQRPEEGAVTLRVGLEAEHNEAAWRAELPEALVFLFGLKPVAAR